MILFCFVLAGGWGGGRDDGEVDNKRAGRENSLRLGMTWNLVMECSMS